VFASAVIFLIDKIETNFLSANSISEFSHSLGQKQTLRSRFGMSAFLPNYRPKYDTRARRLWASSGRF